MTDEIFSQVLCDYARMGGATERKEINFTPLAGEPLTDPKIIERVQLASEFGFRATFFTNGILLHQMDIESLLNAGAHSAPRIKPPARFHRARNSLRGRCVFPPGGTPRLYGRRDARRYESAVAAPLCRRSP